MPTRCDIIAMTNSSRHQGSTGVCVRSSSSGSPAGSDARPGGPREGLPGRAPAPGGNVLRALQAGGPCSRRISTRPGNGQTSPYLIIDVCPDKRGGFHYEAAELTKKGAMHARRAPHWLCPRPALTMRLSGAPVGEDAEREASYYRECAQTSRVLAFERGDLTLFQAVKVPLRSPTTPPSR